MEDKKIRHIQDKVTDYRRFSFILLSLSIFLFLGLVAPNENTVLQPYHLIVSVFVALGLAFLFHRKASFYQNQLHEEQE